MRIYLPNLTAIALIIAYPMGPLWAQGKQDAATVHIKIVDTFSGDDLGAATVESFALEFESNAKNLADKFQQNTASGIPFGVYRLRARATGFSSAIKNVYVSQAETQVVLGLRFGTIDFPYPTFNISGEVRTAHSFTPDIHIRLIGLFSELSLDTNTEKSGKFTFAGVPQGMYILVTIQGKKVVDARPVQVPGSSPLVIGLGSSHL
jgi:hypothetical protein